MQKMLMLLRNFQLLFALGAMMALSGAVRAQPWSPQRNVEITIPNAPGSEWSGLSLSYASPRCQPLK